MRPTTGEIAMVLCIAFAGFAVRFALPERMAVEHFDEGVYASNLWFGEDEGYRYPYRHLYAPPLQPLLIEVSVSLFGFNSVGPMLVNLVAGGLTILACWWVARSWFGPVAGLTAAALCAFSDFHLLYSRTALTDPVMSFWMLTAVYGIWRAMQTESRRWIVAAGCLTGLAWWTKYNGWLPLAVGLSGLLAWQFFTPAKSRTWRKPLSIWSAIAFIACLFWSPVWFGLQSQGGYRAVAENHQRYIVGLSGWWESFRQQAAAHRFLDGWMSCVGLGAAIAIPLFVCSRRTSVANNNRGEGETTSRAVVAVLFLSLGLSLVGLAAATGSSVVIGMIAAVGIGMQLRDRTNTADRRTFDSDANPSAGQLAVWMLAAWFLGLLLATPFYRPYPRLTLPWLLSAWIGCGAFVDRLTRCRCVGRDGLLPFRSPKRCLIAATTSAFVGVALLVHYGNALRFRHVPGWQRRDSFRVIGERIVDKLTDETTAGLKSSSTPLSDRKRLEADRKLPDAVLYVYGEPGLFYQLNAAQQRNTTSQILIRPVGSLRLKPAEYRGRPIPTFLLTGPHAHRSSQFNRQWKTAARRFQRLRSPLPYDESDLVLLNEFPAWRIENHREEIRREVQLYRVLPLSAEE